MKTYRLERRQVLPADLETAWNFFSTPANLPRITPPWLGFEITSPVPAAIYAGLIITYRVRPFAGLGLPWVSEITQVNAPHFFVDEQRHGPFSFWHHQHHLLEVSGGVAVNDVVHYRLPAGLFGILAHTLAVRSRLGAIFDFRRHACERIFGSPPIRRQTN